MEDKEDYADELRKDFELRNIIINPKAGPTIDFILVVGIQAPGVPQVCAQFAQDFNLFYFDILKYLKDLCDTPKHDQEAYGHLHPSAFGDRFCKRLKDTAFIQSSAFTFFLLPIIKYRIDREVAKGWTGFVISGLESSLMATRAFTLKVGLGINILRVTGTDHLNRSHSQLQSYVSGLAPQASWTARRQSDFSRTMHWSTCLSVRALMPLTESCWLRRWESVACVL